MVLGIKSKYLMEKLGESGFFFITEGKITEIVQKLIFGEGSTFEMSDRLIIGDGVWNFLDDIIHMFASHDFWVVFNPYSFYKMFHLDFSLFLE